MISRPTLSPTTEGCLTKVDLSQLDKRHVDLSKFVIDEGLEGAGRWALGAFRRTRSLVLCNWWAPKIPSLAQG
jgi:hypothetical protein